MTETPVFCLGGALLLCLTACAPALNWREVKPADAQGLVTMFPCKVDTAVRRLVMPGLEGEAVDLHVLSCQAGGMTWALSHLDAGTPQRLTQALPALDHALWRNLAPSPSQQAQRQDLGPARIKGADSHAASRHWLLQGHRPVSTTRVEPVQVTTWTFARGLTAFQASVWKNKTDGALLVDDPAAEAFVQGFNFPR